MTHRLQIAYRTDAQIYEQTLFEPGELVCPPLAASERFNLGDLGKNGFGSFSRKKRTSAAGPNPGPSMCQRQTATYGREEKCQASETLNNSPAPYSSS